MAGANMNGLEKVFEKGVFTRIKSCEFHFKQSVNRMSKRLKEEESNEFESLCEDMLNSTIKESYDTAKAKCDQFITEKEHRKFLSTWLPWWDARRSFIFRAFAPKASPKMNQAEVIHAGWSHCDEANLSMLEATQSDTRDSLLLAAELKAFKTGHSKGGSGPSYASRKQRSHSREIEHAKRSGQEMLDLANDNGLLIDSNSSYQPPEKRTKKKETKFTITESSSSVIYHIPCKDCRVVYIGETGRSFSTRKK